MARNILISQALLFLEDFLTLSHPAQRAWFIVRLHPAIGISGLGRLSRAALARDLGLRPQPLEGVLAELGRKWIRCDPDFELVWFVSAYRDERLDGPNIRRAIARELLSLPASPLLVEWWAMYGRKFPPGGSEHREITRFLEGVSKPLASPFEAPPKGYRNPRARVSGSVSGSGRETPELGSNSSERTCGKPVEGVETVENGPGGGGVDGAQGPEGADRIRRSVGFAATNETRIESETSVVSGLRAAFERRRRERGEA